VARNRSKPGRSSRRRVPVLGVVERGGFPVLVVGLGNPGRKYRATRHNAGFMAADLLVEQCRLLAGGRWPDGELALLEESGRRFLVAKPATFMNESGRAVQQVLKTYGLDSSHMVVIHDDIDIPLGEVRVRRGGGTAGHRGLDSIVREAGGSGFTRVRVGVGRPQEGVDAAEYVLSRFQEDEREEARSSVERAARAALDLVLGVEGGSG
jgi:peptidyl-tRNA hydrolase, PTH1 family